MNAAMATRNLAKETISAQECTTFELHKSQRAVFNGFQDKVFDYAEHRLRRLAMRSRNRERRAFLFDLIERYMDGDVAVGWHYGQPVYIDVTKG